MKFSISDKISKLETIEEKSFWVISPLVALMGLLGITTAEAYQSSWPVIVSAILCLIIPLILIFIVYKTKKYNYAYPLLCIFTGAIAVPSTFITSGGFMSGMPIFCSVATAICAFCSSKRLRISSLFICLVFNSLAFLYVYNFGTLYPIEGETAIYKDIVFSYFAIAIGLFVAISLIIIQIRNYKLSQDVLQQYFDIEVRKEILKKASNGDLSISSEKRKAVILFADISNFTTTTEKMKTEEVAEYLNVFFTIAEKNIHETGGIIDKYIGDCIMAYWFENEESNCVYNAVKSLLNIKVELYQQSEEIFKRFNTELNFSAGIGYGDIIFGDIGSDNMHDYTVIGDAVNTASRIQELATGGDIFLTDSAAREVKDLVYLDKVETDLYLKGKNTSINVYSVTGVKEKEIAPKRDVDIKDVRGYSLYVCGCRGSFPVSGIRFSEYGGETSCYIIKRNDYAVVIDCGTGLKNAADILKDCKKIDILLTHVHYDHILGLLMFRMPTNAEVRVFSYFDAWQSSNKTILNFMEHPYWPIDIKQIESIGVTLNEPVNLDENIVATFYKSDHPDDGCVIKLMCEDKKVCILADCEDANKLDPEISKDADLLFFDGMFDDSDIIDHKGWGHSTWQQGVEFGKKQNVKKLIITHHNPELGDHTLLAKEKEARTYNRNISFARTGDRILF